AEEPREAATEGEGIVVGREQPPEKTIEPKPEKPHETPVEASQSSAPSEASSGVGHGRSTKDANYRGRVAAHLGRYKRFPPEARQRGNQGSAIVSFAVDGSGRVPSVELARGSGSPALDQEAQAMVRRASPFPPPPDGRATTFTAPVSFRLN